MILGLTGLNLFLGYTDSKVGKCNVSYKQTKAIEQFFPRVLLNAVRRLR